MNKPTFKHICLMHIQQLTNFPYIEKDFDALTDYGLLCKVVDYLNQVIASENAQNENILALYNAFTELKNYVENFFDNLDVQDEINNKLDEMAEDGRLEQIIEQYLNSSAIWGFDTVADMKNATNLINGSFAKTLGYYNKNDGGGATYKIRTITNSDNPNDANIIALNDETLIAELIYDNNGIINVLQWGAKKDGVTDNTSIFNKVIDYANSNNKNIYIPKGDYVIENDLHTITSSISIYGDVAGSGNNELKSIITDKRTSDNYLFDFPQMTRQGGIIKYLSFRNMSNLYRNKCIRLLNAMTYQGIIDSCNFYQYGNALYLDNTHGLTIDKCSFVKCGSDKVNASKDEFAIYIYRSVDLSLSNIMVDHTRYQLYIEDASYVYVTNSHFEVSNLNIVNGKSSIYCETGNYGHVSFTNCSFIGLSYKAWMEEASLSAAQVPFMIYGTYIDIVNSVLSCGSGSGGYDTPYGRQCKFANMYYGTIDNCKIKSPSYITNSFNLTQSKMINSHIQCDIEEEDFNNITRTSRIIYSNNGESKNNYLQFILPTTDPQTYPNIYPVLHKWHSDLTPITTNKREINFEKIKENANLQEYNTLKIQSPVVLNGVYKLKVKSYAQNSLIYEGYFRVNGKNLAIVSDIYKLFGGGYSISIFTDDDESINDIYIQFNMLTYRTNALIVEIEGLEGHPDILVYYVPSINTALTYTHRLDITNS